MFCFLSKLQLPATLFSRNVSFWILFVAYASWLHIVLALGSIAFLIKFSCSKKNLLQISLLFDVQILPDVCYMLKI
jgi:hypothetical protein